MGKLLLFCLFRCPFWSVSDYFVGRTIVVSVRNRISLPESKNANIGVNPDFWSYMVKFIYLGVFDSNEAHYYCSPSQ